MTLLKEFDVFLGNIESHPRNTSESRPWRIDHCRNRKAKSTVTLPKKKSNSTFEGDSFFYFFVGPTSSSTRRTHAKVDNGKCQLQALIVFFVILKIKSEVRKRKKYGNA